MRAEQTGYGRIRPIMRDAAILLTVFALIGVGLWAYSALSHEYRLRSAIQLDSISMTSDTDGWAVGNISGQPTTMLMRATGGKWTILPEPSGLQPLDDLQAVAMVSPGDGWLIAQDPIYKHDKYNTFIPGSVLLRYRHGTWQVVGQHIYQQLRALAMRTPDDGWAVGDEDSILHWDGVHWTQLSPTTAETSGPYLTAVAAPAANEAWATGLSGALLRWDGTTWSNVNLPAQLAAQPGQPASALAQLHLFGLAMTAPGEGWAIGGGATTNGQTVGVILRCEHERWSLAQLIPGPSLHGIALQGASDGWIVGDSGTILRLQDGRWNPVASPTSDPLQAVTTLPSGRAWAAGWGGRLLQEQQGQWSLNSNVTWSATATKSYR